MKHALTTLILLQLLMLIPFYFGLHWGFAFIPSFIIGSWYLAYGLFILSCKALIWLCHKYIKIKNVDSNIR